MQEGREFAVIFRTFGTDLPRVLSAVSRALNEGAHPLFPDLPDLKVRDNHVVYSLRLEGQFTHISGLLAHSIVQYDTHCLTGLYSSTD